MQNDLGNIYMEKSVAASETVVERLFIVKLGTILPFLAPALTSYIRTKTFLRKTLRQWTPALANNLQELPSDWIVNQVYRVIEARVSSGKKRTDLLQLLLDAESEQKAKVISSLISFEMKLLSCVLFIS